MKRYFKNVYSIDESISLKKENGIKFTGVIYCTINLINGHIYIGKELHPKESYLGSGYLLTKRAIPKYGRENFKKYIIDWTAKSDNELKELERKYISLYLGKPYCYNIAVGGTWGDALSNHPDLENIKQKMRGRKMSDEQKEYLSKINSGKLHPKYGKKDSIETRKLKQERALISNKGELNPMYGKEHSDITINKMKLSSKNKPKYSNLKINLTKWFNRNYKENIDKLYEYKDSQIIRFYGTMNIPSEDLFEINNHMNKLLKMGTK